MNVQPRNRVRNKLSKWLLEGRTWLEGGVKSEDFTKTGESYLIDEFAKDHEGKSVVVFDVGACNGRWSEMVIKKVKHLDLHAFEPVGENTTGLDIRWNRVAVSDTPGKVQVYHRDGDSDSSLYERRIKEHKYGNITVEAVSAIRLDDYIEEHRITHIDLLKVDTEGHELSVLKSLGKYLHPEFVTYIQFEYGITYVDPGIYLHDMYQLLKDYRICKLFPHRIEETLYHGDREDFNFVNYVAIPK